MKTSTQKSSNETENGNKSKPLLQAGFLTPYLPYDLQILFTDLNKQYPLVVSNNSMSIRGGINVKEVIESDYYYPIFFPISDLKYKSTSELKSKYGINDEIIFWIQELTEKNTEIKFLTVETYNFLLQYHFDIFNLIEKGFAISVHDIL